MMWYSSEIRLQEAYWQWQALRGRWCLLTPVANSKLSRASKPTAAMLWPWMWQAVFWPQLGWAPGKGNWCMTQLSRQGHGSSTMPDDIGLKSRDRKTQFQTLLNVCAWKFAPARRSSARQRSDSYHLFASNEGCIALACFAEATMTWAI